jgi:hypothetical protein
MSTNICSAGVVWRTHMNAVVVPLAALDANVYSVTLMPCAAVDWVAKLMTPLPFINEPLEQADCGCILAGYTTFAHSH